MDLHPKDKVALVFGAGGGLGSAIAEALAQEGARVGLASLHKPALDDTHARVTPLTRAAAVQWDLCDHTVIGRDIATIEDELGPIDIVVHMTGGPPPGPVSGQEPAGWRHRFAAMVRSVIGITDALLPGMRERGWGASSPARPAAPSHPSPTSGCPTPCGQPWSDGARPLAREVAPDGITANVVVPGRILTPRIERLDAARAAREGIDVASAARSSVASIPVGRYGHPAEYAAAVAFLAGPRASYLTGSTLRVAGSQIPSV